MIKDSELSRLRPSYSVRNPLNAICGVYLLIVGDKLFIGKCYKSFAFTFINNYKLLLNNKFLCKVIQDQFNSDNVKDVWACPLVSINMFGPSNSSTVIDTLYNLLISINTIELAGCDKHKQVDTNIVNAFKLNAPELIESTEQCVITIATINHFLLFNNSITKYKFKSKLKRKLRMANRRILLYHLQLDRLS
jgi:hypothetical protein